MSIYKIEEITSGVRASTGTACVQKTTVQKTSGYHNLRPAVPKDLVIIYARNLIADKVDSSLYSRHACHDS